MAINNIVDESFIINQKKLKQFGDRCSNVKIGIMGGTFDPIHYAHLATAEFIRDNYKLDKILFIPSGNPPHKKGNITDKYDRYNMVLLSTVNNDDFIVSDIEIKREKSTYTIDTLKVLKQIYKNAEIYFITGADAICDIETWKDVEGNFKLANFIAATRPGISLLRANEKIKELKDKYNANIESVYVPSLDISSTYIREQLNKHKTIRYLVPELVQEYIYNKKLYSSGEYYMNLELINNKIQEMLPEKRYKHSLNVANCAVKLSEIYGCDKEKAYIAGIAHDCAKYLNKDEVKYYVDKYKIVLDEIEKDNLALSHSLIGSYIAKYEFGINDKDIINAIKYHTTGKEDMDIIEKIIYIADLIEEDRDFPGVEELRDLVYNKELDKALLISFNNTIKFVIENNQLIHNRTVDARNYLIKNKIL